MRKVFVLFCVLKCIFGDEIYADFNVVADKKSELVFEISGVVKAINVDVSSVVKRGDVLITLDDKDEQIALKMAKNALENAKNALNFAKSTLDKFVLVKDEISKLEFERVNYEYKEALLAKNRAEISILELENKIEKKRLKAPYDGIITQKNVEIASGVIALNQKVLEIIAYPKVRLVLNIDESFLGCVKKGDLFKFRLDDTDKTAKISLIYPTINEKTKKFRAEALSENLEVGRYGEGLIECIK